MAGRSRETLSVDMIVKAISEGFDRVQADLNRTGTVAQKSMQQTKDASTTLQGATVKATKSTEEETAAIDRSNQMRDQMAMRMKLIKQQYDENAQAQQRLIDMQNKLAVGLGAIAAAGAATLYSTTKLAARVETLGIVTETLGKNVGMTTAEIRDLEQAVKAQGITLRQSRQAIAMMIEANVDLAHATDLARLAQDAAVIAGINSSDAFEKLITTIATGNIRMARHMGLMVTFENAYGRMAEAVGKSTSELTDQEIMQARVNEVMRAGTNIAGAYEAAMETAGKKVTSLDRHIEESKIALGEAWLPTYASAIDFLTKSLKIWEGLDKRIQSGVSTMLGFVTVLAASSAAVIGAHRLYMTLTTGVKTLVTAYEAATGAAVAFNASLLGLGAVVAGLIILSLKAAEADKEVIKNMQIAGENALKNSESYEEYADRMTKALVTFGQLNKADAELLRRQLVTGKVIKQSANELVDYGQMLQITADKYGILSREQHEHEASLKRIWARYMEYKEATEAAAEGQDELTLAQREARKEQMDEEYAKYTMAVWKWRQEMVLAAEQTRIMEAGLKAGTTGRLSKQVDAYNASLEKLGEQHSKLIDDLAEAKRKYGENSDKVKDLNDKLAENEQAQLDAAEALRESTAQMLYQQAAAGLDARAALELARSMGVLSEADYVVGVTLGALREKYDADKDGAISAAEGAMQYAADMATLSEVIQMIQDQGGEITFERIASALKMVQDEGVLPDLAQELPDVAGKIEDLEGAVVATEEKFGGMEGQVAEDTTNMESNVLDVEGALQLVGTQIDTQVTNFQTFQNQIMESMASAVGDVEELETKIGQVLQHDGDTITIKVNYVETGKPPLQHGGIAVPGIPYVVGEVGPEKVVSLKGGGRGEVGKSGKETVMFDEPAMVFPHGVEPPQAVSMASAVPMGVPDAMTIGTGGTPYYPSVHQEKPIASNDNLYLGDTMISQHFHTRAAAIVGRAEKRRLKTRRARRMMGV